ncbi:MAG: glycerol-3-phosphate dehydrogenase/oxidase [Anaerolineae bacterium]|nr:glycerol-3-phosphate dehydrogenase/oxidase [Anaerolineae bacterium]
MNTRQNTLAALQQNPQVSVLVIGGGINGIGVFRELALQGIDVLLVEQGDYCSGASAASSHMVHGGLRYLENGEFRLVREAVAERNRLLANAPHAVKPLPTTIPIFRRFSGLLNAPLKFLGWRGKPAERGALVVKLGLLLYDAYTGRQSKLPRHRFAGRRASRARFPALNRLALATATYYDAVMAMPERLALEVLLDGLAANAQARALNYMAVTAANGGQVSLRDAASGESVTVEPQVVVNAAGPWIDLTNRAMGRETDYIGGTKGAHVVVKHDELRQALGGGEIYFEHADGRMVLMLPWMDKVILGTSDIPIEHPDQAACTDAEAEYFLEMVGKIFPAIAVKSEHIVYRFAGVRPLPSSAAARAGQISRDHSVQVNEAGGGLDFPVLSLVGGKWTTFRAFAEQVTDMLLARLGKRREVHTAGLAIGGGRDYPDGEPARQEWLAALHNDSGLPGERLAQLFGRYGTRARQAAGFISEGEDQALAHAADYSRREILFLAQHEHVVRVEDVLRRRTALAMNGQVTAALSEEISQLLGAADNGG